MTFTAGTHAVAAAVTKQPVPGIHGSIRTVHQNIVPAVSQRTGATVFMTVQANALFAMTDKTGFPFYQVVQPMLQQLIFFVVKNHPRRPQMTVFALGFPVADSALGGFGNAVILFPTQIVRKGT